MSKKPENLTIGGLEFSLETDARFSRVERVMVRCTYNDTFASFAPKHLQALIYWAGAARDYEPEVFEPQPGQRFRLECSPVVHRRVADLAHDVPQQLASTMGGSTLDTATHFAAIVLNTGRIRWFRFGGQYVPVDAGNKGDDDE